MCYIELYHAHGIGANKKADTNRSLLERGTGLQKSNIRLFSPSWGHYSTDVLLEPLFLAFLAYF
jgi:hypothetical protein